MTDRPGRRRDTEVQVTVLVDADDDVAVTRALLDAHDPGAGRVVVHPTPAVHSTTMLARDVLLALGCPIGRLAEEQISTAGPAFKTAVAWMLADGVQELIVLRAHLLARAGWEQLIELARSTGVHLVLVQHTVNPSWEQNHALAGVEHHVTKDLTDVIDPDAVRSAPTAPVTAAPPGDLPTVPAGDVHRFRADAWRRLDAADFARVDAAYGHGLHAVCRWLPRHPDNRTPLDLRAIPGLNSVFPAFMSPHEITAGLHLMKSRYQAEALRDIATGLLCLGRPWATRERRGIVRFDDTTGLHLFLTELVADSPGRQHSIARLRGAQAGFLLHGLHLSLPVLTRAIGPGLNTTVIDDATVARIRARTAHPGYAAALATALFTGLHEEGLAALPISALSADAATLHGDPINGRASYFVPEPARVLLAAARTFEHLRGASLATRLLRAGIGVDGKKLAATADRCGLPLLGRTPYIAEAPWHLRVECWWIGTALHGQDGTPP